MGSEKSDAGKIVVPVFADPESWALLMVTSLNVGRGEPGPGDDWTFPAGPADETGDADQAVAGAVLSGDGLGLLRRLIHRH